MHTQDELERKNLPALRNIGKEMGLEVTGKTVVQLQKMIWQKQEASAPKKLVKFVPKKEALPVEVAAPPAPATNGHGVNGHAASGKAMRLTKSSTMAEDAHVTLSLTKEEHALLSQVLTEWKAVREGRTPPFASLFEGMSNLEKRLSTLVLDFTSFLPFFGKVAEMCDLQEAFEKARGGEEPQEITPSPDTVTGSGVVDGKMASGAVAPIKRPRGRPRKVPMVPATKPVASVKAASPKAAPPEEEEEEDTLELTDEQLAAMGRAELVAFATKLNEYSDGPPLDITVKSPDKLREVIRARMCAEGDVTPDEETVSIEEEDEDDDEGDEDDS